MSLAIIYVGCSYTKDIMPEAYFNRGLCLFFSEKKNEAMRDLSKAGELGLYSAYSVMKKLNANKK